MARIGMMAGALERRGLDLTSARAGATRMMSGIVARQSMVLTFEKLFLLSGILFLLVLPLLFFLKAPTQEPVRADVHVEI
jgi:DHA2 family multidrug resistance protein